MKKCYYCNTILINKNDSYIWKNNTGKKFILKTALYFKCPTCGEVLLPYKTIKQIEEIENNEKENKFIKRSRNKSY